jgi:hypothetical protein
LTEGYHILLHRLNAEVFEELAIVDCLLNLILHGGGTRRRFDIEV